MRSYTLKVRQLTTFAVLAAIIIAVQIALFSVPGVQLSGMIIAAITLQYRVRALIPIYVYVLLYCIVFPTVWSIPYFYIWLPLWAVFMVIDGIKMPHKIKIPVSMILCGLYGLSFGILYAPFQMIMMSWDLDMIIKWWISGLAFDVPHAINNFIFGILIVPLYELLKKLESSNHD